MMFGFQQGFGITSISTPEFIDRDKVRTQRNSITQTQIKPSYDKTSKELAPIPIGTPVVVQETKSGMWKHGYTIKDVTSDQRGYIVADEFGDCSKRNRRHIKPDSASSAHSSSNPSSQIDSEIQFPGRTHRNETLPEENVRQPSGR